MIQEWRPNKDIQTHQINNVVSLLEWCKRLSHITKSTMFRARGHNDSPHSLPSSTDGFVSCCQIDCTHDRSKFNSSEYTNETVRYHICIYVWLTRKYKRHHREEVFLEWIVSSPKLKICQAPSEFVWLQVSISYMLFGTQCTNYPKRNYSYAADPFVFPKSYNSHRVMLAINIGDFLASASRSECIIYVISILWEK